MIRGTLVDRLLTLADGVLTDEEAIFMLYMLGVKRGLRIQGAINIYPVKDEVFTNLRQSSYSMFGVRDDVFVADPGLVRNTTPFAHGEVRAERAFNEATYGLNTLMYTTLAPPQVPPSVLSVDTEAAPARYAQFDESPPPVLNSPYPYEIDQLAARVRARHQSSLQHTYGGSQLGSRVAAAYRDGRTDTMVRAEPTPEYSVGEVGSIRDVSFSESDVTVGGNESVSVWVDEGTVRQEDF